MNIEKVIGDAARDHKALLTLDPANKTERSQALAALQSSIDALNRDLAQLAFQGGRSQRKQWMEIQKQVGDFLDDGKAALEHEEPTPAEALEKIDIRYQRLQTRVEK